MLVEGLDDLNKALLDVVASEYVPETVMRNCIKGLLEGYKVVKEVALILKVLFNDNPIVVNYFNVLRLALKPAFPPDSSSSSFVFNRLMIMRSTTLLKWLIGLMVLYFWHC